MPDPIPTGGSVQTTTTVALGTGAALVIANYLVHPVWPPPAEVMAIVVPACTPAVHLVGRAIYRRFVGYIGDGDPAPPAAPISTAIPPTPEAPHVILPT